ncbi:MAG TPA: beta/gamma crystallin family protein [Casimicrobiaceae bacterium]|nr:beta/gamma crystallin family protein [Casimicrobiaceae bacterium]
MKRSITRIAVAAALGLATTAALAGEIILYENPGFQGRGMTLRGTTPDLDRTQFNDRAKSVVVRDGVWEVCTDAHFAGHCVRLQPGEYANLGGDLSDRISSAREIAQYAPPPPVAAPRPGPGSGGPARAVLYEGEGFRGRSFEVQRDVVRNLDRTNFNDRAASLRVYSGYWIFCSDANFEGDCRTFGPGDYPDLPGDLNRRISSGRQIHDRYPYGGAPNWGR